MQSRLLPVVCGCRYHRQIAGRCCRSCGQPCVRTHAARRRRNETGTETCRRSFAGLQTRPVHEPDESRWLFENAAVGDAIPLRGPAGSCFYLPDAGQNDPLLLSAVGTGLAPLFGILNDALAQGHRGPVTLVHGSGQPELLYYRAELQQLAQQHVNFCYVPVVLENPTNDVSCRSGDAASLTMAALDPARIAETRVFLCGNPDFVRGLRKQAFMKGVRSANIFCDAFVQRPVAAV